MKKLLLFIFILQASIAFTQPNLPTQIADSLWKVWENESLPDTSRLKAILDYAWDGYLFTKPDSAFYYAQLQYDFAQQKGIKSQMANALNTQGVSFAIRGDYSHSVDYYTRSLKIKEETGDKQGIASSLNNIGMIYNDQGDYTKAMDYYSRSLNIYEETEDKYGIATSLNNIGMIFHEQGEYAKALNHYTRSLKIEKEIGNKHGEASSLQNIGKMYHGQGDYVKANDCFNRSLNIYEETGDKRGVANYQSNIMNVYADQGNYTQALDSGKQALQLAQGMGATKITRDAAHSLWQINKKLGRHQQSLEMYELYIASRDSIKSEENQKEIIRQEYKYEYDKQATADSIKAAEEKKVTDAQLAAQEAQLKQEEVQRYTLYGGLGLLFLFGSFMYNRFRVTNKQKGIIQQQKSEVELQKHEAEYQREIVEEKNREITDSITYAKRIQSAILPPQKLVREYLPESFILYKPKDIVAGDFYWMEQVKNTILFAAADCTGHGVPGAMVSVVCNNGLNRSVREYGLRNPGEILDKTRAMVISEFEKSEEEVKDGMDISLCVLDLKMQYLQWAGANNPIWIIRNNELLETKPNKQPIGVVDNPQPFTTHEIELQEGDIIYVFTDGFQDQFGGEKGKKFKPANFKKLLLSISSEPMGKQREVIDETFEQWKGNLEQLDDVCVIGVRITK
ncbi:MAG: tetratricopeptide repeat protein [Brumimicrobium sp.]